MCIEPRLREELMVFALKEKLLGRLKLGTFLETNHPGFFISLTEEAACPDSPGRNLVLIEKIGIIEGRNVCVFQEFPE